MVEKSLFYSRYKFFVGCKLLTLSQERARILRRIDIGKLIETSFFGAKIDRFQNGEYIFFNFAPIIFNMQCSVSVLKGYTVRIMEIGVYISKNKE